jgi:hypothetical protein
MRIVHIALSPVAGAPLKVVNALNAYTAFEARLVNLAPDFYGKRTFPEDLRWPQDRETIHEAIDSADIIHFHQSVLLQEQTLGIDFADARFNSTRFVREWHSEPGLFKKFGRPDIDTFAQEPFPLLVMAQYHERYYPEGIPVPLLTNVEELHTVGGELPFPPIIAFSPSTRLPLREWRWTSKGYDETLAALESLQSRYGFQIDIIEDASWAEAIERKRKATFVIDDLVTGSFHTSGLEGLALGKPTFAHLDARTAATLANLTGSNALPFINCTLGQFPAVFEKLIQNRELCRSIGDYSRNWMRQYYHEKILVRRYVDIYQRLMDGSLTRLNPPARTLGEEFLATELFDILHKENIANL